MSPQTKSIAVIVILLIVAAAIGSYLINKPQPEPVKGPAIQELGLGHIYLYMMGKDNLVIASSDKSYIELKKALEVAASQVEALVSEQGIPESSKDKSVESIGMIQAKYIGVGAFLPVSTGLTVDKQVQEQLIKANLPIKKEKIGIDRILVVVSGPHQGRLFVRVPESDNAWFAFTLKPGASSNLVDLVQKGITAE